MIYIVRHGQTNWNLEGRNQGSKDIDINYKGIKQAKELKEQLKNIKFDKVISSPLKRAYNTAKIISDINVETDERIRERFNGELEGKLSNEIYRNIDFNSDETNKYGIEHINDFRARINSFCEEITNNYKDKNVLIVTHAGVSIYTRCFFEGDPVDNNYSNYKLKNCKYLKYDIM